MRPTTTVGARELKTRLGTYLRRVRAGERILVTERGTPVAELRGLGEAPGSLEARLTRLQAEGLVARPTRRTVASFRAVRSRGASVAEAVVEGRGDRF